MRSPWRLGRHTIFGDYAFASLAVAVVSGVGLALAYDAGQAYDSIALLLLTNPAARLFRNVHYWSAQAFLVLTLLHTWDHLRRWSEVRLTGAVWARVTASIPVVVLLMLSGFMLKGDAEALQAFRIVTTALDQVPWVGTTVARALFGGSRAAGLGIVYLHHVATFTIVAWLVTAEHARRVWPRALPVFVAIGVTLVAGLLVAPSLHDGLDPLVKGPWYFLGLQELLHWTSRPEWLLAAAVLVLAVIWRLRAWPERRSALAKRALAGLLLAYAGASIFAFLFRGENWAVAPPARAIATGLGRESLFQTPPLEELRRQEIPVVLGRREGCLFCHETTSGLSASHRAETAGCSSCHAGNPFSLDKTLAHGGLIPIPGNLADARRACGLPQCHPSPVDRVPASIMSTMSGVIAVDRVVFGEPSPRLTNVTALANSAADTHLRQLCASCHIGAVKTAPGPVTESSRGGGCNACHLVYTEEARRALAAHQRAPRAGVARMPAFVHPDLSIRIGNDHCFGCHSRSGRISTNYEGWHELEEGRPAGAGQPVRRLEDGRLFVFAGADVHAEQGMLCIDCHTARETMGDGVQHAREREQVRVACEDCHRAGQPDTVRGDRLDAESRRILAVRGWPPPTASLLRTGRGAEPLTGAYLDAGGIPRQRRKADGSVLPLRPPASVCLEGRGHARLSCESCHTAWAPRCSGCHTRFDARAAAYDHIAGKEVEGAWVEEASDFRADPPALGVRAVTAAGGQRQETIATFIPGMVLTIDRNRTPGRPADTVFRRLYARTFSHTITRRARACESCHADPAALGLGRGSLRYVRDGAGGRWTFTPEHPSSGADGLPRDAWVGFLRLPSGPASTAEDARPLTPDEQKRILTAGACLTCHAADSRVMRDAIADFGATLRRVSPRCALPYWTQ